MPIRFSVLGKPGFDNALLVILNSGERETNLLFDCGEQTVSTLSIAQRKSIDAVYFSHFHIDHIAGFDAWFRTVYDRQDKPNLLFGPEGSIHILGNRLRGFLWNLHSSSLVQWKISEIRKDKIVSAVLPLNAGFEHNNILKDESLSGLCTDENFTITPIFLSHSTVSLGYIIREKPKWNINKENLRALGLQPGPWVQVIKESNNPQLQLTLNGNAYNVENLRKSLMVQTEGDSIAYLTDFHADKTGYGELTEKLQGCKTIVCESQYSMNDAQLAEKNSHLTTIQAAMLAYRAGAERLILFHISSRYRSEQYPDLLAEAREIFPNTVFPPEWQIPE